MVEESTWLWADMLAEFRALGGTAENVRLGFGPRGRGLFPIDPQRDVRLHTPPHLLVDVDDVILAEQGHLTVRPESAMEPRVKAFFERFERVYSFSAGSAEDCRRKMAAFHALPEEVQDYLNQDAPPEKRRYPAPTSEAVLDFFKETRKVERSPPGALADQRRYWLMPVVELVNHSGDQAPIDLSNGAGVVGRFSGEILATYGTGETWSMFMAAHFVAPAFNAFSVAMNIGSPSGRRYEVGNDLGHVRTLDHVLVPVTERQGNVVRFSHVLLGNRMTPGLPRWGFRRIMREHPGDDPDELFDVIANRNWTWFSQLLLLLEKYRGPTIEEIRRAARMQLETMAFASGTDLGPLHRVATRLRSSLPDQAPGRRANRKHRRR